MPRIKVLVSRTIEDKISSRHHITVDEVWEMCHNTDAKSVFYQSPRKGEKRYLALGQTFAGRYLAVAFVRPATDTVRIITARDMKPNERRRYQQKRRR